MKSSRRLVSFFMAVTFPAILLSALWKERFGTLSCDAFLVIFSVVPRRATLFHTVGLSIGPRAHHHTRVTTRCLTELR